MNDVAQTFSEDRYTSMPYRRCGRSGLMLPPLSLGCWHNFGDDDSDAAGRQALLFRAFDLGVTHFDLANNYGPPPGSAEINAGRVIAAMPRDELIISSKAGYRMWPGPYGEWGSRKNLIASCDQSLQRMGLEYFDIFYSHRPDPETPLEETMAALEQLVRQGKALYAGISSYRGPLAAHAATLLRELSGGRVPLTIHQPRYNLLDRWIEEDLLYAAERYGFGIIAFCPLAQGLLTGKYLKGIPADSRIARPDNPYFNADRLTPAVMDPVRRLAAVAAARGQTLAQMALSWVLRDPRVTSALIGARTVAQLEENVAALRNTVFTAEELAAIDKAAAV